MVLSAPVPPDTPSPPVCPSETTAIPNDVVYPSQSNEAAAEREERRTDEEEQEDSVRRHGSRVAGAHPSSLISS